MDEDGCVEITVRLDADLHAEMQAFFGLHGGAFVEGYQDFFRRTAEALSLRAGGPRGRLSFLELLDGCADQKGVCLETLLYGRAPNEHDRLQLYALLLGLERLSLVEDYEQAAWRAHGRLDFAQSLAKRLARDLERDAAAAIIEEKTPFDAEVRAEALHWLDIELAALGKR